MTKLSRACILFINPNIQYLAAHTYERNISLSPKERVLNPFLTLVVGALLGVPHACKTVEALLSMLRLFTNSLFNLFPPWRGSYKSFRKRRIPLIWDIAYSYLVYSWPDLLLRVGTQFVNLCFSLFICSCPFCRMQIGLISFKPIKPSFTQLVVSDPCMMTSRTHTSGLWKNWTPEYETMTERSRRCATSTIKVSSMPSRSSSKFGRMQRNWW